MKGLTMGTNRCVLITNGNLLSMLSLGDWLQQYGECVVGTYVTYNLPSQKSNAAGVASLLWRSGWAYTHFKLWTNVFEPGFLRRRGLPASVGDLLEHRSLHVPLRRVSNINATEIVAEIERHQPEWIVSFSATQRFGERLIAASSRATVNVHWGALPAYAGLSPYFWHVHGEEKRFGVTLHRIDKTLDTGPILEQTFGDISGTASVLGVALAMTERVSPMLCRLFDGTTRPDHSREQDVTRRRYYGHPTRRQVRRIRRRGRRMIHRTDIRRLRDRVADLSSIRAGAGDSTCDSDRPGRASGAGSQASQESCSTIREVS